MMKKIRKEKTLILIWGFIYWLALSFSFVFALQVQYSSTFPLDFNIWKYVLATLSVFLMLLVSPGDNSVVDLSIHIILYFVVFPIAIFYSCQNRESLYYLSISFCMIVVETLVQHIKPTGIKLGNGNIDLSKIVIFSLLSVLVLSLIVLYRERGIPSLESLDFSIIYQIRSSYELTSLASRLFLVSTKAIVPFLAAVFFIQRNYKRVLVLLLIQFLFFLWLANKTSLFSIAVLVVGYFIGNTKRVSLLFSQVMSVGLLGASILPILYQKADGSIAYYFDIAYSLLVRRTLMLPAYLKYCYYEYFVVMNNPHEGLFGTFVAPVLTRLGFHHPYERMAYTRVIGDKYYSIGSNANTGVFGAELAHFGFFGLFISSILLLTYLICVKKCELSNGKLFTCCLIIYTTISLNDTGVIQLIDFSPLFLIALIAYFFELNEYDKSMANRKRKIVILNNGKPLGK